MRSRGRRSPTRPATPDLWPAWDDRRTTTRDIPLESRAWIGWWAGEDFCSKAVRLLDISQGGAAIEMDELPPVSRSLWLRLARPEATECVEATVVRIEPECRGAYRIGLSFEVCCPDELYRMAVGAVRTNYLTVTTVFPDPARMG